MRKDITYKSWWWRSEEGFKNFGDELGAVILTKMGYKIRYSTLEKADILTTGTILDIANGTTKPGVIIWGSGSGEGAYLEGSDTWDIRATRGALTNERLGRIVPMGDPALLCPLFWKPKPKKYKIGVVKHYLDTRDYPMADVEIYATWDVNKVIETITECEFIISSSLHGLIIAESYGIPNIRSPHGEIITGDWKYVDFITSLNRPMKDIQNDLIKALQ